MNTMDFFVWLLPVLFMIHEFEEIFMAEPWFSRNKEKIKTIWPKKKPFGLDYAENYITSSIAIGIFSEFIFVILICLLCAIFQNYYAWYGFLLGFVLAMPLQHGGVCLKFKGYVPGIVTSAILFIPCIWVLYQTETILHYGVLEIVLSTAIINGIGGLITFNLLHKSMASWSTWLYKYSKAETKG
jgi:hypothetical protein